MFYIILEDIVKGSINNMPPKYIIADEEEVEFIIGKNLTILEKQIDKCDKQALITAVNIQSDLSYYLYEKHMSEDQYHEYKSQLSAAIKHFMKENKCCK